MDHEKKYKELVGKIEKAYLYAQTDSTKAVLEDILPELKESEDERIKREFCKYIWTFIPNEKAHKYIAWLEKLKVFSEHGDGLYYFGNNGFTYVCNPTCDNVSWIEKQGDKPQGKTAFEAVNEEKVDNANKVEPKFKVGDFIVNDYCMGRIVEITNDAYLLDTEQGIPFSCHSTRLWDITKDAKDGDLIYVGTEEKGIQAIFHEYKNGTIFFYCYLCGDFAQGGYMPIGSVELAYPLQKNHYNRFFEKMKEAGYEWDAEKKEPKKIEPKFKVKYAGGEYNVLETKESVGVTFYGIEDEPNHIDYVLSDDCEIISGYGEKEKGSPYPTKSAIFSEQNSVWSEEDEVKINRIVSVLENLNVADNDILNKDVDWLKSLKDRVGCEANCTTTKELSESDEEEFQIAIDTLVEAGQRDSAHWLESIKDRVQPHWKPRGEQIDAFEHFVKSIGESGFAYPHNHNTKCVYSLLNDLKKL